MSYEQAEPVRPESEGGVSIAAVLANEQPWAIEHGDCLDVLRRLPGASIHACVTDPPAGIGFMGVAWDSFDQRKGGERTDARWDWAGSRERPHTAADHTRVVHKQGRAFRDFLTPVLEEVYRVLMPGAHALVWALPRTSHWTATAIEDAGFEVRDVIVHLFGSGFPKSLNLGDGWGTALKPASEHWILARKPLAESTVAKQMTATGTGGINVDACRVATAPGDYDHPGNPRLTLAASSAYQAALHGDLKVTQAEPHALGRWPSNLVLSHAEGCELRGMKRVQSGPASYIAGTQTWGYGSVGTPVGTVSGHYADADGLETVEDWRCVEGCPVAELDRQSGITADVDRALQRNGSRQMDGWRLNQESTGHAYAGEGGASRFFPNFHYAPKASTAERNIGLDALPQRTPGEMTGGRAEGSAGLQSPRAGAGRTAGGKNHHPTVKSLDLMAWLVQLVTPPGGIVIDPFAGSGSTIIAAQRLGFRAIGIEQDAEYVALARARVAGDAPLFNAGLLEGIEL